MIGRESIRCDPVSRIRRPSVGDLSLVTAGQSRNRPFHRGKVTALTLWPLKQPDVGDGNKIGRRVGGRRIGVNDG